MTSASRRSSVRRSRWAASAAASPTTSKSSASWSAAGIEMSPVHEILLEESVIGWKEFELEVMRDKADNFVVICSIENVDPMGVHTGDSITVAPALTLTDREYQRMRDLGRRIIRRVGVETGGSNIQFAINPGERPDHRHRDEPARVAVVGAGVEGDRVPDREDRGQARARLSPRRDPERHHAADAGVLRADDRLRRREGAALGVREVPPRRSHADDADEVGGGGDGDRPDLQGSLHEGVPVAGARVGRPAVRSARRWRLRRTDQRGRAGSAPARAERAERSANVGALPRARSRLERRATCTTSRRSIRWFLVQFSEIVELQRSAALVGLRGMSTDMLRALKRAGIADRELATVLGTDEEAVRQTRLDLGHQAGLQADRHLRRRIRVVHAVPVRHLRAGVRSRSDAAAEGRDPRQRPEPDRAGDRVRLLLLSCRVRACATRDSRPSWSTAIPKRSRPTTTPSTGCTSSR